MKKQTQKKNYNDKEKRKCWLCGKQGHLRVNCKSKSTEQTNGNQQKGFLVQVEGYCDDTWKDDSGCSSHMTRDKSSFTDLILFDVVDVTVGDDSNMEAKGRGTVVAELFNGTICTQRKILDVLWVSNLYKEGLISMGILTKRGFKVELEGRKLKVFDKNKIILVGVRDSNNLYNL